MSPLPSSSRRRSMGSEPAGWDTPKSTVAGRQPISGSGATGLRPPRRLHAACMDSAHRGARIDPINPTVSEPIGPTTGDHHTIRALFAVILLGLTALVAGFLGFQAGVASNVGAAGGAVYMGWGFPFGFLFFPFFFLLFFGFLAFALGGRRRGPWGDGSDPRRQWVADAHRRLHEEEGRSAAGTSASTAGTQPPSPFDPPRPTAG